MKSMTGYGKYVQSQDGFELTVEIKSVNNRYLDINGRLPKYLLGCEEIIRKTVGDFVKRGSVDIFFSLEQKAESPKQIKLDSGLVSAYCQVAKQISKEYEIENDLTALSILKLNDIAKIEVNDISEDALKALLKATLLGALDAHNSMREVEGEAMKLDLTNSLCNIERLLENVQSRASLMNEEFRQRIGNRMKEILAEVEVDQARLLNEVAFYCDRADINEEIARLKSHIAQFNQTLNQNEPSGRKLDFLSQEINREINTIGSKSNNTELTAIVVELKVELEKIKEQIRNVE